MMSWLNPFNWFGRGMGVSDGVDPRNLDYPLTSILPDNAKPRSMQWSCPIHLNQGSQGACVGFSIAHEAAATPIQIPNITKNHAMMIYKEAQRIDEWPGENYSGTSLNAGLKIAKRLKWIEEYHWALSVEDLALAIGHCGPSHLAISWYQGMANPRGGFIYPNGKKTGRHAILCKGYDHKKEIFTLHNSWGTHWGWKGDCKISLSDMDMLLKDRGFAAIPTIRGRGENNA